MEQGNYLNSPVEEPSQGSAVLRGSPSANTSPNLSQSQPTRPRSHSGSHGAPPKIRRRNRLITSCLECRRRKLKCDKAHPCGNCTKFVRDCVFLAPALDPAAQLKLAEIKEKMGTLERTLEEDVARGSLGERGDSHSGLNLSSESSDEDESPGPEDEKNLEPTPLAFIDAAYYEDADDDTMDLGVKIGKMRITERLGGFVRPKIAFEVGSLLVKTVFISNNFLSRWHMFSTIVTLLHLRTTEKIQVVVLIYREHLLGRNVWRLLRISQHHRRVSFLLKSLKDPPLCNFCHQEAWLIVF